MEHTYTALRDAIVELGCESGGCLDMGCFYCGGDDGRYGSSNDFVHAEECLYVRLQAEQVAPARNTTE